MTLDMFAREHAADDSTGADASTTAPPVAVDDWFDRVRAEERQRQLYSGATLPGAIPGQRRRRMQSPAQVNRGLGIPPYRE